MDDFGIGVAAVNVNHYGQCEMLQHADGNVPLFVSDRIVFHRDVKRIREDFLCLIERYAVFAKVCRRFLSIPREYRYHLFTIVYTFLTLSECQGVKIGATAHG